MTGAVRTEILSSLVSVRQDVERHVVKLDRYRALQAIEKTIEEFPGLDDLNQQLSEIRERMRVQIEETREVRALRAVEKILPDLSDVLAFLAERTEQAPAEPVDVVQSTTPDEIVPRAEMPSEAARPASEDITVIVATSAEVAEASHALQPTSTQYDALEPTPERVAVSNSDTGDSAAPANDIGRSDDSASSAPPTFSYGIAQFLNPDESAERHAVAETGQDEESLGQFRSSASQEGRAA